MSFDFSYFLDGVTIAGESILELGGIVTCFICFL